MKLFIITFYKLKIIFSDITLFAAMVIIPLFITIASGYALRNEKLNVVPIAVADEDVSEYSKLLIQRLSEKEGIRLELTNRVKAVKMVENNRMEAAFIIKKGFQEKIKREENQQLIEVVKSPASFSYGFASEVIAGEVIRFTANNMAAHWVTKQYAKLGKPVNDKLYDEVIRYTDEQWEPKPLMTVDYQEMEGSASQSIERVAIPSAAATSAGMITVFIMFYILFSSGWLVEERKNGTLKRLVSGPDALGFSFLGSIFSLIITGMVQIMLFALVNKLVFDVEILPGVWSYGVLAAYLLAVISISMFLSSVLKTPAQLQAGAPVFALITGLAGGCFWNFADVSSGVKKLSYFTPQGWALDGINRLLVDAGGLGAVQVPIVILTGISLILLPLSYIIIRKQVVL